MRSRLFSMAAKPQALAGHLSQLQLEPGGVADWDTARGCSAHPHCSPEPPHGTERGSGQARREAESGGRRDQSSPQMQTLFIYKGRRRHFPFLPSSSRSLCMENTLIASVAAHWPQPGSESWSTCRENQSSISTEKHLQADDEGLEKPVLHSLDVKPYAVLQSPSFLLHLISSSNKLPQEPAFLRCIF